MTLDATYVPTFTKKLVSGVSINNAGYHQTIGKDVLVVTDGSPNECTKVVATGRLNKKVGLFQMDMDINKQALPLLLQNKYEALSVEALKPAKVLFQDSRPVAVEPIKTHVRETIRNKSWLKIHRSLGHCSDQLMRETFPDDIIPKKEICHSCLSERQFEIAFQLQAVEREKN